MSEKLSKTVTIEFEVTDDGVETSTAKVFFNGSIAPYITELELSLKADETFGFFTITQSRTLGCETLIDLMEQYNDKTPE
jgi:hypothetical protein